MRRFLAVLGVAAVLVFAGSVQASVSLGTWTAPGDFDVGVWMEFFGAGGPGSPGSTLVAGTAGVWTLQGAALTEGSVVLTGVNTYTSTYTGGILQLGLGPWGDGSLADIPLGPLTVVSVIDPNDPRGPTVLQFDLTGSSLDETYVVAAHYVQNDEYLFYADNGTPILQGGPFGDGSSVTVSHLPEPATAVIWGLLGLTATGFGLWRRKRAA